MKSKFDKYVRNNNVVGFINYKDSYSQSIIIEAKDGIITRLVYGNGDIRNYQPNIVNFINGEPAELIQDIKLFGIKKGGANDAKYFVGEVEDRFWPLQYDLIFNEHESLNNNIRKFDEDGDEFTERWVQKNDLIRFFNTGEEENVSQCE